MHSTKRSSTSKPWPKAFLSIISPGGTWPYICRQRANLSLSSGTARYTYVSGTRYTELKGVRSRNSRLFPELNPHRSAGDAFCLGARSSRDLVSNNAMPAPLLLSRQRPPSSFTRHILSHDDDARFSNNLASFTRFRLFLVDTKTLDYGGYLTRVNLMLPRAPWRRGFQLLLLCQSCGGYLKKLA